MPVMYHENENIQSEEIIAVFKSVGWNKNKDNIVQAFKNSHYITARDNGMLIGFARAISDNQYYTGIYDVVVNPHYQRQGIGQTMVRKLVHKFKGTYLFLTYTEGNKKFYEGCGFIENENSMWIPKES